MRDFDFRMADSVFDVQCVRVRRIQIIHRKYFNRIIIHRNSRKCERRNIDGMNGKARNHISSIAIGMFDGDITTEANCKLRITPNLKRFDDHNS